MIIGEIRRYLRDNNPIRVSRSMRDLAYRALSSREKLRNDLNRDPTVEEISKDMEIPREEIVVALDAITEPVSLVDPIYNDDSDSLFVMDQITDKGNTDESWIDEIALRQAISHLSPREKRILSLRFYSGKTQMEVAGHIGISQAQVSRLEKSAIEQIKKYF
jgi:RNA polymerase sporulation-specific sigma factor